MLNLPSAPLTEKNGCLSTPTYEVIHGCTSHLTWNIPSGWSNWCSASLRSAGMAMLNSWLTWGNACTLCSKPSEFLKTSFCPVITPMTCGWYRQPFWSIVAGVDGGLHCASGNPELTYTKTLPSSLLGPSSTVSVGTVPPGCFEAQVGSAAMLMVGMLFG